MRTPKEIKQILTEFIKDIWYNKKSFNPVK